MEDETKLTDEGKVIAKCGTELIEMFNKAMVLVVTDVGNPFGTSPGSYLEGCAMVAVRRLNDAELALAAIYVMRRDMEAHGRQVKAGEDTRTPTWERQKNALLMEACCTEYKHRTGKLAPTPFARSIESDRLNRHRAVVDWLLRDDAGAQPPAPPEAPYTPPRTEFPTWIVLAAIGTLGVMVVTAAVGG